MTPAARRVLTRAAVEKTQALAALRAEVAANAPALRARVHGYLRARAAYFPDQVSAAEAEWWAECSRMSEEYLGLLDYYRAAEGIVTADDAAIGGAS